MILLERNAAGSRTARCSETHQSVTACCLRKPCLARTNFKCQPCEIVHICSTKERLKSEVEGVITYTEFSSRVSRAGSHKAWQWEFYSCNVCLSCMLTKKTFWNGQVHLFHYSNRVQCFWITCLGVCEGVIRVVVFGSQQHYFTGHIRFVANLLLRRSVYLVYYVWTD